MKPLDRIILGTFAAIVAGVPLFFLGDCSTASELSKVWVFRSLVLVGGFFVVFKVLFEGKLCLPKVGRWFLGLLGVFFLVFVVSMIFSDSFHLSFLGSYERQQGMLQWIFYFLFFGLFVVFFKRKKGGNLDFLIDAALGAGIVVALIAVFQKFSEYLVFGTFGHPNSLAGYLLILLPFFVMRLCERHSSWKEWGYAFGIVLVFLAMILTGSRAAVVGVAGGVVFAGIFGRNWKLLLVPVIMGFVFVLFNFFAIENLYLQRFSFNGNSMESVEIRLNLWPAVIDQILERPMIGYGPDMMGEVFLEHMTSELRELGSFDNNFDRAHNEILDIAVQTGVIGLTVYLMLLIFVFRMGLKNRSDPLVFASLVGLFSLFTANMFGFSTTVQYVFWWIMVGVIVVRCCGERVWKVDSSILIRSGVLGIFGVFCVIFIWFGGVNALWADLELAKANEDIMNMKTHDAFEHLERAIELAPYQPHYYLQTAEYMFLLEGMGPESLKSKFTKLGGKFLDKAKALIGDDFVKILFLEGKRYAAKGEFEQSFEFFEKAYLRAPFETRILLEWARNMKKFGDPDGALGKYEKYLDIAPYWDEADEFEQMDEVRKTRFRRFFKGNFGFLKILEEIAETYEETGDEEGAGEIRRDIEMIEFHLDNTSTPA